jgi:phosphate transport system permease protein
MTTLKIGTPAAPMPPNQPPVEPAPERPEPPDRPRALSVLTVEDKLAMGGSFIGSLGLAWLLYYQILPFQGLVGFVIFWYVCYLAMFAAVTLVDNPLPIVIDRLWSAIVTGAAMLVGAALLTVVGYTIYKGWVAFHHLNFFTQSESKGGPTAPYNQGGVLNALVGSLIELGIATVVALPLGIGTAVFMVEVGGKYARVVRTVVEAMTALPDILAGLFVYTVLIVGVDLGPIHLKVDRGGFAAAMALTVMMIPIIARSADVALRVVPGGLREAGYALGASTWQTVWRVVLPTCRSGLATAVILGMARAVGETAPVLIASGASTFLNTDPLHNPMNSLPLYIVTAARSGEPVFEARGFAAGILLLMMVVVLFAVARFISRSKTPGR